MLLESIPKGRLLVIDDEPSVRQLLKQCFERQHYIVDTAENGEDGLEKFRQVVSDIVICDITMPVRDGFSTLKVLDKERLRPEIIMMTGYVATDNIAEVIKFGAFDYIMKPFALEEVRLKVDHAVAKRQWEQMVQVTQAGKDILMIDDLQALVKRIVDVSRSALTADVVSLMLVDQSQKLYIAQASGLPDPIVETTRVSIGERLAGRAVQMQETLIVESIQKHADLLKEMGARPDIRSSLIQPIFSGGQVLGVLNAARTSAHYFHEGDKRIAKVFADYLGMALLKTKIG